MKILLYSHMGEVHHVANVRTSEVAYNEYLLKINIVDLPFYENIIWGEHNGIITPKDYQVMVELDCDIKIYPLVMQEVARKLHKADSIEFSHFSSFGFGDRTSVARFSDKQQVENTLKIFQNFFS